MSRCGDAVKVMSSTGPMLDVGYGAGGRAERQNVARRVLTLTTGP